MTVVGMEGMHSKMFDPPTESPETPELLAPTNPVPEVMEQVLAAADTFRVSEPHTVQRDLLHGVMQTTWDGQDMHFMTFRDSDLRSPWNDGHFPGPTIRVPRGVIFHATTKGHGPPPHTIHWHGQEPSTMNDGVGHCSMEIGDYVYQWQPNFIGSYFHHCHRNTLQHFEFGLYGFTVIDPPDAYFATQADPTIPAGAGRDRKFRTQANLAAFPQFGQDNFNDLETPDPGPRPGEPNISFLTDPHAYTVPYDVEALWVVDDRDIRWSNLAQDARATFPVQGTIPGVNDNFVSNAGGTVAPDKFFAFNDFRSTHFYVTGVNVPAPVGGTGTIGPDLVIPPELMSGKSGVQISINAEANQNILLRFLNAAYNNVRVTFPVDIVIIAWDGRALGVPPYGKYNAPVLVPAGTTFEFSVARRFDAMIRSATAVSGFATVQFIDTLRRNQVRATARIPINIAGGAPQPGNETVTVISAKFNPRNTTLDVQATSALGLLMTAEWFDAGGVSLGTADLDRRGKLKIKVPNGIPDTVKVSTEKGASAPFKVNVNPAPR
jgi:hypothetical protein